eukprot:TRINITY_DN6845_c0_g1_i1.p1 TRINITY_DN6845_c0_g1~~TRINITY_DN6845_c0_g1_i1.p1  ORF type:complete len:547 (+),score=67.02 TRINITY_DN6845_c0_g1_i1:47-1687(+)
MADDGQFLRLAKAAGFDLTRQELPQFVEKLKQLGGRLTQENVESAIRLIGTGPFASSRASCRSEIGGSVAPGFEAVRAAFQANFAKGLERDAQLCIYHRGVRVVDLWGSSAEIDVSTAPPTGYDGNTLQMVWSSTKMMEATVCALAVDRGWFRYDDKVAKHWPEYAQNGKAEHTVADVLRHDVGLEFLEEALTPDDVDDQANPHGRLSKLFASATPWTWPDGPDKGKTPRIYHGQCRGFILNQILIRVDPQGRTAGRILADEVAGPLGADFFCGSTPAGWNKKPIALMRAPPHPWSLGNSLVPFVVRDIVAKRSKLRNPDSLNDNPKRAYHPSALTSNPLLTRPRRNARAVALDMQDWEEHGKTVKVRGSADPFLPAQSPRAVTMEVTSNSGRASARGMARIMAMWANRGTLDGVQILSPQVIDLALQCVVRNLDRNNEDILAHPSWASATRDTAFSQGGIANTFLCASALREPRYLAALRKAFGQEHWGWGGFGGSSLWFNRWDELGFGYTVTGGNAGVLSGESESRLTPILVALQQSLNARSKL